MKPGEYRKSVKLWAAVLEIISVTMCVVCIGIVSCNAVISVSGRGQIRNYYISPFSKTAAFQDSDVFEQMMYDGLKDVIRYCVIREQMETDGVFDEMKEIDIEQYARHFEEIRVTDTSITYHLGDLIRWGQSGDVISKKSYSYEEAEQMIREAHGESESGLAGAVMPSEEIEWQETAGTAAGRTEHTYEGYEDARLEAVPGTDTNEETVYEEAYDDTVEEDLTNVNITIEYLPDENIATADVAEEKRYVDIPVERYLPADGQSVLAHVDTVEELEEMVYYLEETVRMLGENYASYKEYQKYYANPETNFRYCVFMEKDGKADMYSNAEVGGKSLQDIGSSFSSMGKYLCFSPADLTYESNTSIEEDEVRRIWEKYRYAYSDRTMVWIGIDTLFLYQDEFKSAQESYNMAAPGYFFMIFSAVCGILALVLLGVMTFMAGRKPGRGDIALLRFDNWYTEIAAVTAVGCVLLLSGITGIGVSELYVQADGRRQMLTVLALGTASTCGAVLFFYLSLVRRIKAGIFWNNFLVYRLFVKIRNVIMGICDDSRNVVRVWIPYLLFVVVNLFLISLDDPFYSFGVGTFMALVLDLFVGAFLYYNNKVRKRILEGIENIRNGDLDYQIDVERMHGDSRILAEAVNSIGNGIRQAVETSMKDERMKADLITNVSHDIKTPLTSIINYVDLIKREPIENDKIKDYLKVLDSKSQRLKQLTEDLVEASKISSGNIELQCDKLNLVELMNQTVGEFIEKFEEKGLHIIVSMEEEPLLIYADSRRIWRVVENLFNNVYKYALENTRVYIEVKKIAGEKGPGRVRLSIKNISDQPLNIEAEDLTERFIRGDMSRTTEGSGLGLSIAKNLTELQKGRFELFSDGDLFKVVITFALVS